MIRRRTPLLLGGGIVVALALAWVPAAPAGAHAVLLATDPPAQSTLAKAPELVRLQFSEAVDTQFGYIRVFDHDGHDVTTGHMTRRASGLEVDMAIRPKAGTSYVNWQVVSTDGHVERGSYSFAVGAPSPGPPRAAPSQPIASATAGWLYGAFRFGWFTALFALIGLAVGWIWLLPLLAGPGAGASAVPGAGPGAGAGASAVDLPPDAQHAVRGRARKALVLSWVLLCASGVGVLVGQAANDAGRSLLWAARPSSVAEVLRTTAGHYWLAALIVAAASGVPVVVLSRCRPGSRLSKAVAVVVGLLMCGVALATALDGHARTLGHAAVGVPALTVHLVAVGVWAGGLGAFVLLAGPAWRRLPARDRSAFARLLIGRFGQVAVLAVIAVIGSGAVSALLDLGSPADLINLPYGRMLLIKLVLLQVALLLGARHRWFGPGSEATVGPDQVGSFRRGALAELGILGLTVVAASSLMVMVPSRATSLASIGELDLQQRAGAATVSFALVPNQPGEDQIYVLFADQVGAPMRRVTGPSAVLSVPNGPGRSVPLVWVSDGRFTGTVDLPSATRYGLAVSSGGGVLTTFTFKVAGRAGSST